jgi:hypothetical protein
MSVQLKKRRADALLASPVLVSWYVDWSVHFETCTKMGQRQLIADYCPMCWSIYGHWQEHILFAATYAVRATLANSNAYLLVKAELGQYKVCGSYLTISDTANALGLQIICRGLLLANPIRRSMRRRGLVPHTPSPRWAGPFSVCLAFLFFFCFFVSVYSSFMFPFLLLFIL